MVAEFADVACVLVSVASNVVCTTQPRVADAGAVVVVVVAGRVATTKGCRRSCSLGHLLVTLRNNAHTLAIFLFEHTHAHTQTQQ